MNIEDLRLLLPGCTWNQLFSAIDHLSREGKVALHRGDRCTYVLSLGPQSTAGASEAASFGVSFSVMRQ